MLVNRFEDYLDPAATRRYLDFEHEQYEKAVGGSRFRIAVEQQLLHESLLHIAYEGESAYHLFGSVQGNAGINNPKETLAQKRGSPEAATLLVYPIGGTLA